MSIKDLLFYLIIIGLIFCFVYLPKREQEKKLTKLQQELKQGDKVITYSGLSGSIESIDKDRIVLLLNPDQIRISIERWAIAGIEE